MIAVAKRSPVASRRGLRYPIIAAASLVIASSLVAHASRKAAQVAPVADAPTATTVVARIELSGLGGLACVGVDCTVLVDGSLRALNPLSLELGPPTDLRWGSALAAAPQPMVVGACEGVGDAAMTQQVCTATVTDALAGVTGQPIAVAASAPRDATSLGLAWNQARASGDRVAFAQRVPSGDGGSLIVVRSKDGNRLMRTGHGVRFAQLPADPSVPEDLHARSNYVRNLALHPTGQEAYVLTSPGSTLIAFDPRRLEARWKMPLSPIAHGLFISHDGRWMVIEEAGLPDEDRLMDLGEDRPLLPAGVLPASDLAFMLTQRPSARSTALMDLAGRRLAWREAGRYRALVDLPDGTVLLATDKVIVRLQLPPPQ